MAREQNEFFIGYVEEVQGYIPVIRQGIKELQASADQGDTFAEIYRLVHIIRGASAMVGIDGLSQVAGCMETALEQIQAGELALSAEAFAAMASTVDRFALFCQSLRDEIVIDEALLLAQTKEAFARIGAGGGKPLGRDAGARVQFGGEEFALADPLMAGPDEELLGLFRVEAEEHLEALQLAVQALKSQVSGRVRIGGDLAATVGKIRRCVQTIKGAAAVFGLHDLAALGQLIADLLDWLQTSASTIDPPLVGQLTEAIDLLATMILAPEHFDEQRAERVLAGLQASMASSPEGPGPTDPGTKAAAAPAAALRSDGEGVGSSEAGDSGSLKGSIFSAEEQQQLRQGFQEEAEEHLQHLHQSLEVLAALTATDTTLTPAQREEIGQIRRSVHTIKGASAVIGLGEIAAYAHGVEDFLDWLYEGACQLDQALVKGLTESIDLLGLLVVEPDAVAMDRQNDIHRRLQGLAQGVGLTSKVAAERQGSQDGAAPPSEAIIKDPPEAGVRLPQVAETAKTIRINQQQLDALINLANELLVGVSGFDQNMGLFKDALADLELTSRRLKGIALELETKFEVKALDRLAHHFDHLDKAIAGLRPKQGYSEFDALELDRYTQLNLIIRSLNEAAIDVSAIHTNLGGIYSGIGGDINRQHRVIRELQVQMMRTRMSPMSSLAARLKRTMRDVAARLGKGVRLVVEGERIELDRMVWEKLADPFMHLVRNAIHHGIEPEDQRLAANKPALATITLAGRRQGNHMVLRFSDDGRGLDFDAIRAKARRFGLGARADQLNEDQLTELIFHPGFSTKTISEISGRGVGMDVVKENVRALQGTITVETSRGSGTTFVLRIPLTLGVVRALMVTIGEVTYGIALNDIKDIHRVDRRDISSQAGTCKVGGAVIPWYSLPTLLGRPDDQAAEPRPLVLVLALAGATMAIGIPGITGQKELVIKGLGTHLGAVPGIAGAAIMGDGSIVPVLSIPDLIEMARKDETDGLDALVLDIPQTCTVMIVDDSISIRRVMSRLVTANGWIPVEAKDGLDAIEQLAEVRPDCIVLDIEMPRMNGFEFLTKLANLPMNREIPVIMLTSRASDKHRQKALQLGAAAFLIKPCRDEEFVATVVRLTQTTTGPPSHAGAGGVLA